MGSSNFSFLSCIPRYQIVVDIKLLLLMKMMPVLVIALSGCDRGSGDGGVWPVAV